MNFKKELVENIKKYDSFTVNDFSDPKLAKIEIKKLLKNGTLAKASIKGIFYKPKTIKINNSEITSVPDLYKLANTIARINKWKICPDGLSSTNKLHLSTQVPVRFYFSSTGPTCQYDNGLYNFEHCESCYIENHCELFNIVIQAVLQLLDESNKIFPDQRKIIVRTLDNGLNEPINWRKIFKKEMTNLPKEIQKEILKLINFKINKK